MPQGTPTPKVIGLATKLLLATWKISTRCRLGFVRYSSLRLALKIASAILPPSGNDRVTPATRVMVSSFAGPEGLIVEKVAPETPRFNATALSTAKPCTTTCVGKVVIPGMAIENVCTTSVALPLRLGGGRGGTPTESPTSTVPARSVTMNPILLMPLGSVACTVMESPTSARDDTKCSTCGGVRSFTTDRMLTVTGGVLATRNPESTAKPFRTKNPLVPVTSTESTKSIESGNGGPAFTSESPLVAVWPGETSQPTRRMPDTCTARTWIGTYLPLPATAPVSGAMRVTRRAWTFARKMKSVSSVKLPAPSVARPTMRIRPPAPEFDGNVMCTGMLEAVTVDVKTVSVSAR